MKRLLERINFLLKSSPSRPKCYSDDRFLYCWCGKCEPKDYELPQDFREILAIKAAEEFNTP